MSAAPDSSAGPPLVLIVDDNPDLLSTLEMLIVALGANAMLAASGGAAIAQARQRAPDVVLLDIGLPDIDGYEVARRLRHEVGLQQAYLVGLSGHAEDEAKSKAAGIDFHQLKPIPLEALRSILAQRRPARPS